MVKKSFWTFNFDTFCVLNNNFYFFPDTILGEDSSKGLPIGPVKLRQLREHIGMELLWTEQAIQSRKKVRNHVITHYKSFQSLVAQGADMNSSLFSAAWRG